MIHADDVYGMSNINFNGELVYVRVMVTFSKFSHTTWKQTPPLVFISTFLDPMVHLSAASIPLLAFGKSHCLSNFVLTTLSCISASFDWSNMAFSLHLKLEMG